MLLAAAADPPSSGSQERLAAARRRRWLVGGGLVLAVLAVLRLLAPSIIAASVTARISAALGVSARVEAVELRLVAGEITVRGIHAAPPADASASSLAVDTFTLRWRWRDLVRGVVELEGRASGLDATVELHRPWPATREAVAPRSSSLRSFTVERGAVQVVMAADAPPILALTDLRARVRATSELRTQTMTTHVSVTARANERGTFTLDASLAPIDPATKWTLRFALERLDLRPLNPLLQQVFEMDLEHGWLSLAGSVAVASGRLRGRIHPRFDDLEVLGDDEHDARHPMAEALLGSMLSGADLPVDIDRPASSTEASMLDSLAQVDPMELLGDVILRGFTRRLDTLDGYHPAVGRVELDFPAGRLSFFDITLTRLGGAVDRPFVSIARMDIIVEQRVVDGARAYKAIILHEPSLVFVTGRTPERSQITFDPDWQEKVNVLPYPTDRVEIIDGRVEYRDDTTEPRTSLVISDLDLSAVGLARAKLGGGRRGAKLLGRGRVMDLSQLAIEIDFSPGVVVLDAAARLRLEPVPLRELNALLEGRLGIDVSSGTLALAADLDARDGHLTGTVTPVLRGVRVLGADETRIQRPVRELLLERRLRKLDGTTLTLDYGVRTSVLRELPPALMSAVRRAR